jgi:8-oxo-dGTP pyrophosphatase MutT (NUDIX family)
MPEFKTIFEGGFTEIITPEWADTYEILHEGNIVIILPILDGKIGVRKEWCPPYIVKDKTGENKYYTVVSGHVEEGEDVLTTGLRELKEEAGITILSGKMIKVFEEIPVCKSTDMRATFFIADIEKYEVQRPEGDGSEGERRSETVWITLEEFHKVIQKRSIDMLVFSAYAMVKLYIKSKGDISIAPTNNAGENDVNG